MGLHATPQQRGIPWVSGSLGFSQANLKPTMEKNCSGRKGGAAPTSSSCLCCGHRHRACQCQALLGIAHNVVFVRRLDDR